MHQVVRHVDLNKPGHGYERSCLKTVVFTLGEVSNPHKHMSLPAKPVTEAVPIGFAVLRSQSVSRNAPPGRSTSFDPLTSRLRI